MGVSREQCQADRNDAYNKCIKAVSIKVQNPGDSGASKKPAAVEENQ